MIQIEKPADAPDVLTTRGVEHCGELCAAFNEGKKPAGFRASIYAHVTVKAALKEAQHGKCCFCERRIGDDGDVEHFRPKGGWKQQEGDRTSEIGYFWLAYDWVNLLLCCSDCNSRHKGNLFPLTDPTKRADATERDTSAEDPLFINPAERDPADYIGFREEYAYAINGNQYGTKTLEALGLNTRENIVADRRDYYHTIRTLRRTVQSLEKALTPELLRFEDKALVDEIRAVLMESLQHLHALTAPDAPFTAMVRLMSPNE